MNHKIKIKDIYADKIVSGEKTFEVRFNDRDYQVGDYIEFIPIIYVKGRDIVIKHPITLKKYEIVYIQDGEGLIGAYVVLGITEVEERMNTKRIKNLEQIVKQAQEQIREFKKEEELKVEYPKEGDTVWYINLYGQVQSFDWKGHRGDKELFNQGSVFLTEEEAEFESERERVIKELELFAEPKDRREWDCNTSHYFIAYNLDSGNIEADFRSVLISDNIYFATKEDLYEAIDFVGRDKIMKYYLRIED